MIGKSKHTEQIGAMVKVQVVTGSCPSLGNKGKTIYSVTLVCGHKCSVITGHRPPVKALCHTCRRAIP